MSAATQYGVVPFREEKDGRIRILLITSRETKRWVVPRGNPMPGLTGAQSAAQEAWEEAGIRGGVSSVPLGTYSYDKRLKAGGARSMQVELYRMLVTEEADSWPEKNQRERRWFDPAAAADAVDEPDLKQLLRTVTGPNAL
jgi:8-oxo-dGTP pyrophosphatase MutT (NUDIX family)